MTCGFAFNTLARATDRWRIMTYRFSEAGADRTGDFWPFSIGVRVHRLAFGKNLREHDRHRWQPLRNRNPRLSRARTDHQPICELTRHFPFWVGAVLRRFACITGASRVGRGDPVVKMQKNGSRR
jgi:hypothetical protein